MWAANRHRSRPDGWQGCGTRKTGKFLQEQCTTFMAFSHSRPQGTWSKEVFWKILCRYAD